MEQLWYTKGGSIPFPVDIERAVLFNMSDSSGQCLFRSEKEAINEARKHAKAIEERWYGIVRALDARTDAIEVEEMRETT